jgi:MFS transporter, SHS family, lactate transporter
MYPTLLLRDRGFSVSQRSWATAISMIGAILGGSVFGMLSDRFGRRRTMMLALAGAILAIPLWAFSGPMGLVVLGAFLMQFMVQGSWGVVPAHLTELSPDSVRGFLPGFGYQMGVLLSSPVNYAEAAVAKHIGYAAAMSMMAAVFFMMGIVATALGPERRGAKFGE